MTAPPHMPAGAEAPGLAPHRDRSHARPSAAGSRRWRACGPERLAWLLAVLFALQVAPPLVLAGEHAAPSAPGGGRSLVLTERGVWAYAETLLRRGEYYRAVSEYQRLLHYFPGGAWEARARLRIAEAHILGGEAAQAVGHIGRQLEHPAMTALRPLLLFLRGIGRLELDSHLPYTLRTPHLRGALADLRALDRVPPDAAPPSAAREYIPPETLTRLRATARGFVNAMHPLPAELPSRSPWLAGGLSALLPGAGSAYGGRWSEAALSFFINALFIGAALNAAENDERGLSLVLGAGALAFYSGNIYAAVNGAHKYNDRVKAAYLRRQRSRFGLLLGPGGISGIVRQRF